MSTPDVKISLNHRELEWVIDGLEDLCYREKREKNWSQLLYLKLLLNKFDSAYLSYGDKT